MKRDIETKLELYVVNTGWRLRCKVLAASLDEAFNKFDKYYSAKHRDIIGTGIEKFGDTIIVTYHTSPVSSRCQRGKEIFYIFQDDIYFDRPDDQIL